MPKLKKPNPGGFGGFTGFCKVITQNTEHREYKVTNKILATNNTSKFQ